MAVSVSINEQNVVDLTYTFDENTVYWPTDKPFEWKQTSAGMTPGGYWYASAAYSASEHGGTHIDSPIHFGKGKMTLEEIPLSHLIGPAMVIDITEGCTKNRDYEMTAADVEAWENKHGQVREGAIVLVFTGWGKYWPDKKQYLGTDKPGDVDNLHFPGISEKAAKLLSERKVHGVGIDTPSIDPGVSKTFPVHQVLNGANIYGLENVANMDKLPPTGATVVALPMKIKGGTGGPVRIIALLP
jgi:kynurenine formamidase